MLDFFNLPNNVKLDQQTFIGNSDTAGSRWYDWIKPRGINMINIFMLGGGGGAGNGPNGTQGGAGGGGASGNQYNFLFLASSIPDVLYFSVGIGGSPPAAAGAASSGIASYASVYPNITTGHLLGIASGGGGGSGFSSYAGGANTAADNITAAPLAGLGMNLCAAGVGNISLTGQAGTAGPTTTFALPVTGLIVTGGSGGGNSAGTAAAASGANSASIPSTVTGTFPTLVGGVGGINSAGSVNASSGSNGIKLPGLNYFYGGTGGGGGGNSGGTPFGAGGVGGGGSYGCGGGGGGAGAGTNGAGGAGGAGGPGIVIVTCF
jgi:hypothetical protein